MAVALQTTTPTYTTIHVDAAVGIRFNLTYRNDIDKQFAAAIKHACQLFIDWLKIAGTQMNYPKVKQVPVYDPVNYRYPRKTGKTYQLRKSLTGSFFSELEPQAEWDTPYASAVLDKGRVRRGGSNRMATARWPEALKAKFRLKLYQFLRDELGVAVAKNITITPEADN